MTITTRKIALAALVTTALGTAVAVVPSYAQQAPAAPATPPVPAAPEAPAAPLPPPDRIEIGRFGGGFGHLIGGPTELLELFDTDGNGTVTQEEIDGVRAAQLAEFDANGDGQLNLEEYQAYWLSLVFERMVDAFQHLDANGDGEVTAAEFNDGLADIVVRLDQDGDGALGPTDRPERPEIRRLGPGLGVEGPGGGRIFIQPGGQDGPRR
ncbi:MAG: EF-hand domain-containing protein [Bauldia sp.]